MRTIPEVLADARADLEAAEKATPGPWQDWHGNVGTYVRTSDPNRAIVCNPVDMLSVGQERADAANIARNADPARVTTRARDLETLARLCERLAGALRAVRADRPSAHSDAVWEQIQVSLAAYDAATVGERSNT